MKKRKKKDIWLIEPKMSALDILRELNKRRLKIKIETPLDILSELNKRKRRKVGRK